MLYKNKSEAAFVRFIKKFNQSAFDENMVSGSTKRLNIQLKKKGLLHSLENDIIRDMFDHIDTKYPGKISKMELEKFISEQVKAGDGKSVYEDEGAWKKKVRVIFKKYDKDRTGYLDKDSFRQLYQEFINLQRKSMTRHGSSIYNENASCNFLSHDNGHMRGFNADHIHFSIKFKNLGLKLKLNNKTVLKNVSGEFFHSQLIAIMGPSGCGKSTFLNTLCGRAYYGDMTGAIHINHKTDNMLNHRKSVGFVPQEDVVFDMLTVYENLMYSCELRLFQASKSKRKQIVEDVIHLLELENIRNSVVGSVEKGGISGGQRKRVNIGMELVADPSILFLDEPTSGLDSASASVVLSALKELTHLGITIIAVIHQPKYSIFDMFDQLLLLGTGGETVFCGPVTRVKDYFEFLHFKMFEANANLADFIIDVCAGIIPRENDPSYLPTDLPKLWERHGIHVMTGNEDVDILRKGNPSRSKQCLSPSDISKFLKSLRSYMLLTSTKNMVKNDLVALCKLIDKDSIIPRKSLDMVKRFVHSLFSEPNVDSCKQEYTYKTIYTQLNIFVKHANTEAKKRQAFDQKSRAERSRKFRASLMETKTQNTQSVHMADLPYTHQGAKRIEYVGAGDQIYSNKKCEHVLLTGFHQYFILQHRCFVILIYNSWRQVLIDTFILIVCGIITGGMMQSKLSSFNFHILPIVSTLSVVLLGVLSAVSATSIFGNTKLLFFRERSSNLYVFPYFISRIFLDMAIILVKGFVFGTIFYDVAAPLMGRLEVIILFVIVAYASTPVGYISSIIIDDKPSAVAATAAISFILGGLMTGVSPDLSSINTYAFPIPQLYGLSYGRWAVEGMISEWVVQAPFPYKATAEEYFHQQGYTISHNRWAENVVTLFLLGTVLRLATLILLTATNRDRQLHKGLSVCHRLCFYTSRKRIQQRSMAKLQKDVLNTRNKHHKSHFKFDRKRSSILTDVLDEHNEDHSHTSHAMAHVGRGNDFVDISQSDTVPLQLEKYDELPFQEFGARWTENPLKHHTAR